MKLETILNAMVMAELVKQEIVNRLASLNIDSNVYRIYIREHEKRYHQYNAFRSRILKMDAEKDARITELEERIQTLWWDQND